MQGAMRPSPPLKQTRQVPSLLGIEGDKHGELGIEGDKRGEHGGCTSVIVRDSTAT